MEVTDPSIQESMSLLNLVANPNELNTHLQCVSADVYRISILFSFRLTSGTRVSFLAVYSPCLSRPILLYMVTPGISPGVLSSNMDRA